MAGLLRLANRLMGRDLVSSGSTIRNLGGGGASADPNYSDVSMVSDFEGTDGFTGPLTDDAPTPNIWTFGGTAQLDTAQKKFGDSSLLLDGNSDYLHTTDKAGWDLGSGNFTIEGYVRFANAPSSTQQAILAQAGTSGNNAFSLEWYSGDLRLVGSTTGGSMSPKLSKVSWAGGSPTPGQWYYVSFCRNGEGAYGHIDGVGPAAQGWTGAVFNSTATVKIGSRDGTKFYWDGHIDSLRFTKGVARYAAGVNYTPPDAPHPTS